MTTDDLTHEQVLEKAQWIDKLRELGFVWDGNIADQPNLSQWKHKNIRHFTGRLALISQDGHPQNGHFVMMLSIGLSHVMRPDIHLGAESIEKLEKIYNIVTESTVEEPKE